MLLVLWLSLSLLLLSAYNYYPPTRRRLEDEELIWRRQARPFVEKVDVFPLQNCQGDCEADDSCDEGLICYPRPLGPLSPIPGCRLQASSSSLISTNTKFCVLEELAQSVGGAIVLQNCQSDCDTDEDCGKGLYCYQREQITSPIPGCNGISNPGLEDFCVAIPIPLSTATTTQPSPWPSDSWTSPTVAPSTTQPISTPTSSPSMMQPSSKNPTLLPRTSAPSSTTNDPTAPHPSRSPSWMPIQTTSDTPSTFPPADIPATSNLGTMVDTPTPTMPPPTKEAIDAEYVGNDGSPRETYPLQTCQGDCDSDGDCDTGLLCYERQDEKDPIPGCQIASRGHGGPEGTDFCVAPENNRNDGNLPVATVVGNDNIDESLYPLKMCQGDCDEDWNCEFPLICYQRDRSSDPIPGCSFDRGLVKESDFCVPSQADDGSKNILEGAFRLRLYWEEGYVWQESTVESFWCASTNYDNDPCWYGRIGKQCRSDHMYLTRCGGTSVKPEQQAFVFVPFDDRQVLIQSANRQDLRCWERSGREILLRTCDADNPLQRWIATDGTSFFDPSDNRFEISQIGYEKQCVSNDHHPKEAEAVELHSCVFNRDPESQTAYWERF